MSESFKRKKKKKFRGLYAVLWASGGAKEDSSCSNIPPLSSPRTEESRAVKFGARLGNLWGHLSRNRLKHVFLIPTSLYLRTSPCEHLHPVSPAGIAFLKPVFTPGEDPKCLNSVFPFVRGLEPEIFFMLYFFVSYESRSENWM